MFASIGVGIAAGVYGILIALIGTIGFCLSVFILHYSPLTKNNYIIGTIQFGLATELTDYPENDINKTLAEFCSKHVLVNYRIANKKNKTGKMAIPSFEYRIRIDDEITATKLVNELTNRFNLVNVTLNFKEENEKI